MENYPLEGRGYDVFVRTYLKNSSRQIVGKMWTLRTSGHCRTDLELARAYTQDLTRMGVPWQIRNAKDEVIEEFRPAEKPIALQANK